MTKSDDNGSNETPPQPPDDLKNPKTPEEQLELLKWCSDNKNIKPWNDWRDLNEDKEIHLEGAILFVPHLEGVDLIGAHLEGAQLYNAHLKGASLGEAHLEGAQLHRAHLEDVLLIRAHLQGTSFDDSIVDGNTLIDDCYIDRDTDFSLVSLDACRIDPATKQLLQYNVRRDNWQEWYKEHPGLKWLVRWFWKRSDYGRSTGQIIKTFLRWAFAFALVYYAWGCADYYCLDIKDHPGIVSNLFVFEDTQQAVPLWLVPVRSVYFSIVTMTTLGFGDMYASGHSFLRGLFGHVLLGFQVLLGYVLLGVLITRFAVLFIAGGPAGEFTPMSDETKQLLKDIERKRKEHNEEIERRLSQKSKDPTGKPK